MTGGGEAASSAAGVVAKSGSVQARLVIATCVLWAVGAAQIVVPVVIARQPASYECPLAGSDAPRGGGWRPCLVSEACSASINGRPVQYDPRETLVSEFPGLVCASGAFLLGLAGTFFFLGFMVGAGLAGWGGDRFGRRPVMRTSYVGLAVGSLGTAFAGSFAVYAALRFGIGCSVAACLLSSYTITTEVVPGGRRALVSVAANAAFAVPGELFPLLLAWMLTKDENRLSGAQGGDAGWRSVAAGCALLVIFVMGPIVLWMPESARWLVSQGRAAEAKSEVARLCNLGENEMDDADEVLGELLRDSSEESASTATPVVRVDDEGDEEGSILRPPTASASMDPPGEELHGVLHGVLHPKLRFAALANFCVWFVTSFVYYGITLGVGSLGAGNLLLNSAVSACVEVPAALAANATLGRPAMGRRLSGTLFLCISGCACLLMAIPGADGYDVLRNLAVQCGKFGATGTFVVVYVHAVEIFPTPVRALGVGMSSQAARVGAMAAPLVGAVALALGMPNLQMTVFGAAALLCAFLYLRLPETLGRKLPEGLADLRSD